MARFPDREAQIKALAQSMATGLAANPADFPTPPVPSLDLQALLDSLITLCDEQVAAMATAEQATDPATWARQIRATVRFADELDVMLSDSNRVLVEVGPGGSLTGSAIRHPKWSSGHRGVRLMRHPVQTRDDRDAFLLALGQLWAAGVDVDWTRLYGDHPQRVTLPGYAFARQRYWIEPDTSSAPKTAGAKSAATAEAQPAAGQSGPTVDVGAQMQSTLQRI